MPRMPPPVRIALLSAALPLSACSPAADAPPPTTAATPATPASTAPAPAGEPPVSATPAGTPLAGNGGASIGGAIRDGNRPPPALRICAHPHGGGAPTCTDSPAAANAYRIEVAPGRYYLMGWVEEGELQLIAHAAQVRCIRAPCPPDELIEVEVAAGEAKSGIDLSGGYAEVPAGWPARP